MLSDSSDEDDTGLSTPLALRRNSRISFGTPVSIGGSSVYIGAVSEELLKIWGQLPEAVRLDPSLAAFQKEYERKASQDNQGPKCSWDGGAGKLTPGKDCLFVNMSVGRQPFPSIQRTPQPGKVLVGIQSQHHDSTAKFHLHERKHGSKFRYSKLVLLTLCWIIFAAALMVKKEKLESLHQITIPGNETKNINLVEWPYAGKVSVKVEGSFLPIIRANSNSSLWKNYMTVWLQLVDNNDPDFADLPFYYDNHEHTMNFSNTWTLPIWPMEFWSQVSSQKSHYTFDLPAELGPKNSSGYSLLLRLSTNLNTTFPISISYNLSAIQIEYGIIFGAIVLFGLYILIVFEIVHRTIAAMIASTLALAILAILDERPSATEIISWIDMDTLQLLFSMMVIVGIVAETGVFDYLAVLAYEITEGKIWPLVSTLCFFTAFLSTFLDNVTTVLLMTPVTIRLCEVVQLNPVPVLMSMVIFSNIGGAMTPIGDPPNVIIASNKAVIRAGVNFGTWTTHMGLGTLIILVVIYGHFRFIFRDLDVLHFDEPADVQELRHEIVIWQRAAASLSSYSKDENLVRETLLKKVHRLLNQLKQKIVTGSVAIDNYKATLGELQDKYPIRDKWLLVKSGFSLIFVIGVFFFHSLPQFNLTLGWTALLGLLLLLIVADTQDFDGLLARVEWSTLIFFASLFVLMESLAKLGLIAWIGAQTEAVIMSVNEESRLAVAMVLILWVSATAGAFVDNVPLTTMMIRIATGLAENHKLRLPLQPLIWALTFGACMGGNGTLIGATANVVCAGVAEQHGYRITFLQFFKMGFPVTLTSTLTATVYLLISHVVFGWNGLD